MDLILNLPLLKIKKYLNEKKIFTIAIDGKCGAGKTTLAKHLKEYFDKYSLPCVIVHLDNFIYPKKFRSFYSTPKDYDINRFLKEVLIPLKNSKTAAFCLYSWTDDNFSKKQIINPPIILLVEGVNSADKSLNVFLDFKIFINLDKKIRQQRVLKRGNFSKKEFEFWSKTESEIFKNRDIENYYDFIYNVN